MAGQALYRKWRSQTFEEVVGQEHVALTLRNALREGRVSHAYLFTGPRGTGKTSTARILAKAVNCLAEDPAARPCNRCPICISITEGRQLDLIEIDAASNRGIDEIRELRERIGFRPNEAQYKVYIIDEVHMLTKEAFNALLKTLEEPPAHAIFVLATTEPERVPETVRSRCQRFDFRRVPTPMIAEHLGAILAAEGGRAAPEALLAIARRATGSMRDAISLLDQLLSYDDAVLGLARVESVLGLVDAQAIGQLVDHMAAHDTAAGLRLINQLVADGVELGELVDQILAYLRAVLFAQVVRSTDALDLSEEATVMVARQAEALSPSGLLAALREYADARAALRDPVPGVPQLPIEIAFLHSALAPGLQAGANAPGARPTGAAPVPAADEGQRSQATPEAAATAQRPAPSKAPVPGGTQATAPAGASAAGAQPGGLAQGAELLDAAHQNWDSILEATRRRGGPLLKAALQTVRQLDLAGDTLILQFPHDNAREKVEQPDNRARVEAAIEEVLNRRVRVRCVRVGEAAGQTKAPSGPQAAKASSGEDELLADARRLGAVVKRLDQ